MERNREARRAAAQNNSGGGGGLSRRRHRYRESLEEDGGVEMAEMSRLRDRGSKKDRDRSGRGKRRRGERHREEGEESSSESAEDDDDDEDDDSSVGGRLPPPPPVMSSGSAPAVSREHHRKSFGKPARPPPKTGEDQIGLGLFVPRRARTSSGRRSQEMYSGGGGGGDPMHRQTSTSPARRSPNTPVSPSSSSASVRKKMKPAAGSTRPPKISSKSSGDLQFDEIEVAEVLFGLTRQIQSQPMLEMEKSEHKEVNGQNSEAKSRISSPVSVAHQPITAVAPKRKRPRHENPSPSSMMAKVDSEPTAESGTSSPKLAKNLSSPVTENGGVGVLSSVQKESAKPEKDPAMDLKLLTTGSVAGSKVEVSLTHAKESLRLDLDVTRDETSSSAKGALVAESSREVKFSIDLMAPPPGKSALDMDGLSDFVTNWKTPVVTNMVEKSDLAKSEEMVVETKAKPEAGEMNAGRKNENSMARDLDLRKSEKDGTLDLKLDFNLSNGSQQRSWKASKNEGKAEDGVKQQTQKPQSKAAKIEPKLEHTAHPVSLPMQMPVSGWPGPGSFPPFGYMGQVPSLQPGFPMERNAGSKNPQQRPKRCATHCTIAHKIQDHQHMMRVPYWPAAPGANPVPGGKQYNLNAVPPSDAPILANLSHGKMQGSMQDKAGSTYTGHASKEKPSAGIPFIEAAQSKQLVLQQPPQPGPAANMLGPAFLFPLNNQQHAAAVQAAAAASARSGTSKSTHGAGNAAAASASQANSALAGPGLGGAASMSFNFPGMPPSEAQYMALLQNGAYPFPIPTNVGAPPPYRGNSAQAMLPFLNGSFYSPQLLHPPQLQQQQQLPQQPSLSHVQQGHQNTSTSSGSSSSQRPQPRPVGATSANLGSNHSFPALKKKQQHLPTQGETGSDESPTTASSKASQAQKHLYNYNMAMAGHPQNFTLISPAAAALASAGSIHTDKQHQPQQSMKVDLTTSQAFAMSFASFGGPAAGATASPLPGFDFTSMAQNHNLFQGLPESAMKGYQISPAAAATAPASQHKKPHHHGSEDGKSAGERMNANNTGEEERKIMTTGKTSATAPQHSLTFSRQSSDVPTSNTHGNSVLDSSPRTLNLIKAPGGGGRVRSASVVPTTSSSATPTTHVLSSQLQQQVQQQQHHQHQQQQQQFIQLQMQQRQMHQQMQHQLVNRTKTSSATPSAAIYSDHMPAGAAMAKFPQALAGFPQGLIQGGVSTSQWKSSTRASAPAAAVSSLSSTTKNQGQQQQQGRGMQQTFLPPNHQTHISFGNTSKASTPPGQQHLGGGNASISQSSSKNAGGSPRSSSGAMPGPSQAAMLPLQQQQQQSGKHSPSSSAQKSSPLRNSNAPSILGQSNMVPTPNANSKQQQQPPSQQQQQQQQQLHQMLHHQLQQQQHQQLQKQQANPQAQFFYSNAHAPSQASHPNAATTGGFYHQNRLSEQQTQQQTQHNSSPASDQVKAASGSNVKVGTASGMLQQQAQFAAMTQSASGTPHTLMSMAAAGGFPYMQSMPPVSAKPAEQKPAAGNAPPRP